MNWVCTGLNHLEYVENIQFIPPSFSDPELPVLNEKDFVRTGSLNIKYWRKTEVKIQV